MSSARRRIALVGLTHPFRGGISHYTTLLCRALSERHDVRLFALSRQYPEFLFPGKTQYDESKTALAVEHDACLDSINPWSWFRTADKIARFSPELVVFQWWHPFFAPCFGTVARRLRKRGIACCFLCHNAVPHENSFVDAALLRYAFSAADVFVAHSRHDAEDLRRMRPETTTRTSPHPTYAAFLDGRAVDRGSARRELGLEGKKTLLFFGYVRTYKGLDVLLSAMTRLDASYHLLVVGEFYESRSSFEPVLGDLEARGAITLVDRYVSNEEVPDFFAASDLVCVPYRSATQSGVVQLAYAFGKPVVATKVGGLPDVVVDGKTGYLVPSESPERFAAAVEGHFRSADTDLMSRSIETENEKYSWDRMVETIEEICDSRR